MDFYVFIYLISIFFILFSGFSIYKTINTISSKYYLRFSFFLSLWFFVYFLFYLISSENILLFVSKIAFFISIIGIYFFYQFINFFGCLKYNKKLKYFEYVAFILLGFLYLFTDKIILNLYLSNGIFYEIYGDYVFIHYFLSIFLFILIIISFFKKFKKLEYINKIRIKYIFSGFIFFLFFGLLFQTLLPFFNINILQKETILFILPFIFLSWFSLIKYHFSDLLLRLNELISFLISLFLSLLILFYKNNINNFHIYNENSLWLLNSSFSYFDIVFLVFIFYVLYKFFINILPFNKDYSNLLNHINIMKSNIPYLINIDSLNEYLLRYVKNNFNINHIHIDLKINSKIELYKYFSEKNNILFINDLVFLEENKNKFNISKVKKELDSIDYLIFPLKDKNFKIIGFFKLGKKPFKEQYYTDEINIIYDFALFISGHLKYIDIYAKINYLSFNLDKEIDKKTIEYNKLINKQKEFISIASHEIKTPVMSLGLKFESIIDDINDGKNDISYFKKDFIFIQTQVNNLIDLVKVLFNSNKIELGKTNLYLEKVNLKNIFIEQISYFKNNKINLNFNLSINESIKYVKLDKVQFSQVINNLINNAIKFSNKKTPVISISADLFKNNIFISIEDNGNGFKFGEEKYIFEKYTTGKGKSIGLGLGLYLCKEIIELHGGSISAKNSLILGGAKIDIIIPLIHNK